MTARRRSGRTLGGRQWRRLRWWLRRRRLQLAIWAYDFDQLRCGCHWDDRYGVVVMAGCSRHD